MKLKINQLPKPDLPEQEEWSRIPKIARTIPFGYEEDEDDPDWLIPIPDQLDALKKAKELIKHYSLREVANWLSAKTGRKISHVGLQKRFEVERKRQRISTVKRILAKKQEKILRQIEELENQRTGSSTTKGS